MKTNTKDNVIRMAQMGMLAELLDDEPIDFSRK